MPTIPLENPTQPDIYSFGFDKNLNRPIVQGENPFVYDAVTQAIPTSSSGGELFISSSGEILKKGDPIPILVMMTTPVSVISTSTEAADATTFTTVDVTVDVRANGARDKALFVILGVNIMGKWDPAVADAKMMVVFRKNGSTISGETSSNVMVGAGSVNQEAVGAMTIVQVDDDQKFQYNLRRLDTGVAPTSLNLKTRLLGYFK